jgi:hypothetical protein
MTHHVIGTETVDIFIRNGDSDNTKQLQEHFEKAAREKEVVTLSATDFDPLDVAVVFRRFILDLPVSRFLAVCYSLLTVVGTYHTMCFLQVCT